jgi:hypothetical protein
VVTDVDQGWRDAVVVIINGARVMSIQAFFVLLFVVFAVPLSCLIVCIVQVIRGMCRGYRTQRIRRERDREFNRSAWG